MYGKLYKSTFTGSMVGSGTDVIATWAYIVAHTHLDSTIELNPILLAASFGCESARIEKALEFLCAPDPNSRTETSEGRRLIRAGQFMYQVVNFEHYNSLKSDNQRRDYMREYMANRRKQSKHTKLGLHGINSKHALVSTDTTTDSREALDSNSTSPVNSNPPQALPSEALFTKKPPAAKAQKDPRGTRLPDDFELTPERNQFAMLEGLASQRTFDSFCDFWRSKPGPNGTKLNWEATWRNWCRSEADRLRKFRGGRETISAPRTRLEADPQRIEHIATIRALYPKAAREDWITAENLAQDLVASEEATWDQLESAVERYQLCCRARNRESMNPAKFFGDQDRPWSQEWPLPKSKAQTQQDENINAGLDWLEESAHAP